jgi:hypothetical protein
MPPTNVATAVYVPDGRHHYPVMPSDTSSFARARRLLWFLTSCPKATPNNERVGWDRGRGGADSGVSRCRVSSPHVRCFIDSRTVCGG